MTDTQKQDIARNFITALRTRDGDLLKSIMTDDVVWSLPGRSPMSGEAHGVAGILKRADFFKGYNVSLEILYVLYGYQDVALSLHNTGTIDGRVLDEHLTTVLHLQGDKVHRLETYISDVPMLNAYFV
jgi:ketosteroid isomerase-like protein